MGTKVGSEVEKAGDSAVLEGLARVGLIAYGVVHLVIGWLALQIAWGGTSGASADSSGALSTVADQPFGKILLWLVAVGMVAFALWQASEVIWGYHNRSGGKRVRKQVSSGAKAVVYAALGVVAALVAVGAGSSSSQSQQEATSGVLAWPGGQVIVVVAALVIIGVGVAGVVKGVKKSFAEEIDTSSMSPTARSAVAVLGQVGYIARGFALGVVGCLLGYAGGDVRRAAGEGPGRCDADDPGAAVRPVPAHRGGVGIRGIWPVRFPAGPVPPDVTRLHPTGGDWQPPGVAGVMRDGRLEPFRGRVRDLGATELDEELTIVLAGLRGQLLGLA